MITLIVIPVPAKYGAPPAVIVKLSLQPLDGNAVPKGNNSSLSKVFILNESDKVTNPVGLGIVVDGVVQYKVN